MDGRKPKKILAVDDHPLIREALARLVAELERGTAVLEADTVGAAQDCLALHPDIALTVLDVALPDSAGIQGLVRLLKSRPNVPVLVFSAEDDPGSARAVIDAGAIGFVSKRSPTRVLTEALRVVLLGGPHVPPRALHANRRRNREPDKGGGSTPDALTFAPLKLPRQVGVLAVLVQGTPKLIGRTFHFAQGTVATLAATIYRALGVINRRQAVCAVNRPGGVLPGDDACWRVIAAVA